MRFLTTVLLFCTALSVEAAIIFVTPNGSGDYYTLASAYNVAVAGDTILIGPGTFPEILSNINRRIHFLGAGFDLVSVSRLQFTTAASGSTIEGILFDSGISSFTMTFNSADSVTVRRCYFTSSTVYNELTAPSNGRIYIEDCCFMRTYTGGGGDNIALSTGGSVFIRNCLFGVYLGQLSWNAIDGSGTNVEIHNCVFLGFREPFNMVTTNPSVMINNLFHDWTTPTTFGTYHPGSVWEYNGSTTTIPPGSHAILLTGDPFVNYDETANYVPGVSDLHLNDSTLARNAGHPSIFDLDSTVSDLGLYGGPTPLVDTGAPSYPFTISVATDPATALVGTDINLNSVGRIGPQY